MASKNRYLKPAFTTVQFLFYSVILFTCLNCERTPLILNRQEIIQLTESTYFPTKPHQHSEFKVQTFIDTLIQKDSEEILRTELIKNDAEKGCVALMEVQSGEILALVNLEKTAMGKYLTHKNSVVDQLIEPGSFIKTFNVMALLEDGKSTAQQIYSSGNGVIDYSGIILKDAKTGGFGELSLGDALSFSSNVIFAKAITQAYNEEPKHYISRLNNCFNQEEMKLPFQGQTKQQIPSIDSKNWATITLPWLSIGYGLKLSPIQILTYYNALANKGQLVQPRFISWIKNEKKNQVFYPKKITSTRICSTRTAQELRYFLRKAMTKGNGVSFQSNQVEIAGKTTSTQRITENFNRKYLSGFAGYFPHSKPKYSIIVIVDNLKYPSPQLAGEIVKNISEKIEHESTLNH